MFFANFVNSWLFSRTREMQNNILSVLFFGYDFIEYYNLWV